jgi:predicted SAM-dependent methyltransferase
LDHNPFSVEAARNRGLRAFLPDDFRNSAFAKPGAFDSLLLSHVLEHMTANQALALLGDYLPFVKRGGQVILITPQERGFRSDPTHVQFFDFEGLKGLQSHGGLKEEKAFSFPFPRCCGKVFKYNEFVVTGRKAT